MTVPESMELQHAFAGIVQRLRATDAAVIAAVNGPAVGAGMALALAADVRFAAPNASFHIGAVKIGITLASVESATTSRAWSALDARSSSCSPADPWRPTRH